MSNFTGMDVAAVRQLAAQLNNKAAEIQSIAQQLSGQLESTAWVGPDREMFHGDWNGMHMNALNNVCRALESASQRATQNANQQESTSNAG
ncbi:MAG: hypothetical protein ACI83Y_002119 [Candidatus Azotimanducaceae bacterium]|jgi:uncharacterized protein YukE